MEYFSVQGKERHGPLAHCRSATEMRQIFSDCAVDTNFLNGQSVQAQCPASDVIPDDMLTLT